MGISDFILLGVCRTYWVCRFMSFLRFWRFSGIISSKISCPFLSLLRLCNCHYVYIDKLADARESHRLCSLFFILCFSCSSRPFQRLDISTNLLKFTDSFSPGQICCWTSFINFSFHLLCFSAEELLLCPYL